MRRKVVRLFSRLALPLSILVPILGVGSADAGASHAVVALGGFVDGAVATDDDGDDDDTASQRDEDDADDGDDAASREAPAELRQPGPAPKPDKPAKPKRTPRGGCPRDMARVSDTTCMDKFEAPNRQGKKPLVMQSATDAEAWCDRKRKRLCTEDEWFGACEGEEKRHYPYGSEHEDGKCNDDKVWRQVNEGTLAKWPGLEARDHTKELYQAAPSGTKRGCKSARGVYDLTGNVEEWVTKSRAHANGYRHILIGCYWAGCYGGGKPTCHSTNAAHGPEFRFYETGFRCCKDPPAPRKRRHD